MPIEFTSLETLVPFAKARAERGLYDGIVGARSAWLIRLCRHRLRIGLAGSALLIYTRDVGHHTGGWWKNPDYERCYHLSLSYRDLLSDSHAPQEAKRSQRIAEAFFRDDAKLCWIEPSYSEPGKLADVWHYRLFCDAGWQPIKPRGEVYSRDNMPVGWKSFSELHGYTPAPAEAPFLLAASDSGAS